tara:strand:- start:3501 stop:4199 length:699 start_codon:yes stop_codon:yes gene_type:complete
MFKFSIVIPVYNESKNLPILIKQIYKVLKKEIFELIVIDDDSSDGTSNLFKKLRKKNLKYLLRKKDRDLSRSCILGFKKSKYENVLVMDGDLQHRPQDILKIIKVFKEKNADFVIGSRNLFRNKKHNLSFFRLAASRILIRVVNFLLTNKTSDPMSGFFIFKKKIFIKNQFKLFRRGYKILLDLLYSDTSIKKIYDVEIKFATRKKGKSKMSTKILFLLINMILFKIYARFI